MKFRKNKNIMKPTRAHLTDAGLDLYSPIDVFIIGKSISDRIDLGIGFSVPKGYVGIISERSSQGKIGVHTIGNIVDSGYTGNVHVTLVNDNEVSYYIKEGEKICQIYFVPILDESLEEVNEFEVTERGSGAHGSSDRINPIL